MAEPYAVLRLFALGVLLIMANPLRADAGEPPSEEVVLRLVERGASCSAQALNDLLEFDPAKGLPEHPEGTPLTLAVIRKALGSLPTGEGFAFSPNVTPKSLSEALRPKGSGRPSLVRATESTVAALEVTESTAQGRVDFRVPDVYRGRVHFEAYRVGDRWELRRLWFEDPQLAVGSRDGVRWFVETPPSTINARRGPSLQLPVLHCVGAEPPAALRVVITVTADGDLFVEGRETRQSLDGVLAVLKERAADPKLARDDGTTALVPLLDLDASLPWNVVTWLLQLCMSPHVKATRVAVGVMHRGSLEPGAFTIDLPRDRSVTPSELTLPKRDQARVSVFGKASAESDPLVLHALLLRVPKARRKKTMLELVTPPPTGGRVPHGYIMRLLDVACASEIGYVALDGAALQGGRTNDPNRIRALLADGGAGSLRGRVKISLGWLDDLALKPKALALRPRSAATVGVSLPEEPTPHFLSGATDVFRLIPSQGGAGRPRKGAR